MPWGQEAGELVPVTPRGSRREGRGFASCCSKKTNGFVSTTSSQDGGVFLLSQMAY